MFQKKVPGSTFKDPGIFKKKHELFKKSQTNQDY